MCSRIVQHKERLEVLQRPLCGRALHLLRFVHDNDRTIGGNHIDRSATLEVVALGVHNQADLILCILLEVACKSLRIDNHHVDGSIATIRINLCQVAAVIDKIACLLAVLLHEVLFQHRETLIHTLTDSNAWHDHDELRPAITLVHLKHRLDIDVSLTRTRLHLNIERTSS